MPIVHHECCSLRRYVTNCLFQGFSFLAKLVLLKPTFVWTRLEQVCANVNSLSIATLKDNVTPRRQGESLKYNASKSNNGCKLRYVLHLVVVS